MEIKNSKKSFYSKIIYAAAIIAALVGFALLINNILLFRKAVSQYTSQGYSAATIERQLIPSQLIPGIFESVVLYGGVAFILACIGKVNKKVSMCLELLSKDTNEDETYVKEDKNTNTDNIDEKDGTSKDTDNTDEKSETSEDKDAQS